MSDDAKILNVTCPCCGARLSVDAGQGIVTEHQKAVDARMEVDLKDAQKVLRQETAKIHERYEQIVQTEKGRSAAMDKLFKDFMEKAADEPEPEKPLRDIDLD